MPKQKTPKGVTSAEVSSKPNDPRFAGFETDPRYRLPSKKHTRTTVDKRFSRMLKDKDFSNSAKVDRYGRKISSTVKQDALKKLYVPDEEEEEEKEDDEDEDEAENSDIEVADDDAVEKELKRAESGYDAARGGGFSSSEDDSESEDEDGGVEIEEPEEFPVMGGGEQEGVEMGEVTNRIAIVNLDWDNTRAVDLLAVFQSFVPSGGKILKISIYPSEFGKERMEKEELGPPVFAKQQEEEDSEDSEDDSEVDSEDEEDEEDEVEKEKKELLKEDDGKDYDPAALRQYQLERLRYYYAVMICSDKETAEKVYEDTDGTEFGSSANFFDLRFIPDDTEFEDQPRDECDKVPAGFKPTEFITNALQHSKVELTWDKDPEEAARKGAIDRAFHGSRAELIENDVRAYIASGSDTEDEVDEESTKLSEAEIKRQKIRTALGLGAESLPKASKKAAGPVGDMEVTFAAGLSSTKEKASVFENAPAIEETTQEAYIRKEKERKQRKKEKVKAIREGRDPEAKVEVDQEEEKDEDLGFDDPFFSTDVAVKDNAVKLSRKEEKARKRALKAAEAAEKATQRAELELIMQDDSNEATTKVEHFDINEIARIEKRARQRGKNGKKAAQESKRGGLQEGFELDVEDPRFAKVFENHEFAIDRSHPRFPKTEGMKKLLDAGRKRKGGDGDDGEAVQQKKKNRR